MLRQQFSFLHVPKTGGTSLIYQIRQEGTKTLELSGEAVFHLQAILPHFDCLAGHIPAYIFNILPANRKLFTVVRSPVPRVTSFLNHILSEKHHLGHAIFAGKALNWREIFTQMPFSLEACNFQTRLIGYQPAAPLLERIRMGDPLAFNESVAEYRYNDLTTEHLERACMLVEKLITVTTHDYLAFAFANQIVEWIGAKQRLLPRLREPVSRLVITNELLDLIEINNELDSQLYDFTKLLVMHRIREKLISKEELLFDDFVPGMVSGVHPIEGGVKGYRWTDGNAIFPIIPSAMGEELLCRIQIWDSGNANGLVHISLAGVILEHSLQCDGYRQWDAVIPSSASGENIELRIISPTQFESNPKRHLGVRLKSISILCHNR